MLRYITIAAMMLASTHAWAEREFVVRDNSSSYVVKTDCNIKGTPLYVRLRRPEVGERVLLKTKHRTQKCAVVEVKEIRYT